MFQFGGLSPPKPPVATGLQQSESLASGRLIKVSSVVK